MRSYPNLRFAFLVAALLTLIPVLIAQEQDQNNPRTKALTLEQQGQNAEAETAWIDIAKADPANAEALAHLGLREARQEHYPAAIDYYRRAASINPDLPGLQMNLGLALFKIDQFPDALKSFSSEFVKHPGDQRLTILIGMAHYGMKDYLVAIPYLKRATEHDTHSLSLRTTLAHSCMSSRQYQCVLKVQQEILDLKAQSAEMDMLAGEALDQLHDSAGAENAFRAAASINPNEPNVHFGLGYILWTQSKWAEATNEFQLELQHDPKHVARVYMLDSLVQQRQFAKAIPDLEKLVDDNPSEPLLHRDLGIIFANTGRAEDALRELNTAIESDPDNVESHLLVAKLYRSTGREHDAHAELDAAKRLPPQSHSPLQEIIDSIENPAP
jgi:tetratricopeptide (TPR) repeat protein